jgi:F-type H+-transporting ATPase subunit delta
MAGGIERQAGVAAVWSDALARLAAESGREDELLEELEGLVGLLDRDAGLEALLASPIVDDDAKRVLLEKALRGRASDLLADALQVMRRKGRLGLLRAVAAAYRQEWLRRRNRVEVRVTSAVPLTDALRAELERAARARTGREPLLVEKVDSALLGGLVVRIGDDKFDGSVARELSRLEEQLLDRASRELHAGKSYFAETA